MEATVIERTVSKAKSETQIGVVTGGQITYNLKGHNMDFKLYVKFNKAPLNYVNKGGM